MSASYILNREQTINLYDCCSCGAPIALTEPHERWLRVDSSRQFYCPYGHPQIFREGEVDRLRKKLEVQTRTATEMAERAAAAERAQEIEAKKRAAAERELMRTKTRVAGGVCPCCNRTFVQLARHMKTKHPEVA
jgi:Zn ribbon nucleic-acid-binding protein